MLLTDPALRRIAAATGDVWPDRVWRFDTADPGPTGQLAMLLHDTSLRFADSSGLVGRALGKAGKDISRTQADLAKDAHLYLIGADRTFADTLAAIERHSVLEEQLLAQYAAWRTVSTVPSAHGTFHLLVKAGDPGWGVVRLEPDSDGHWRVFPDGEAATHFGITHTDRLIGEVAADKGSFAPTAYSHPHFGETHPQLVYRLPGCDDLQSACRSLLRWWAFRESVHWDGRTPTELDPAELAAFAE